MEWNLWGSKRNSFAPKHHIILTFSRKVSFTLWSRFARGSIGRSRSTRNQFWMLLLIIYECLQLSLWIPNFPLLYGWRITTNDIHVIFRKWLENCLKNLWKEDVIILCHRPEIRTKKEETKWCLKPTIVINNDKSSSLSLGEISLLQLLVRWCLCTRYSDSNDYLRFSCDQTLSSSDYFEETYVHTFNRNWFE